MVLTNSCQDASEARLERSQITLNDKCLGFLGTSSFFLRISCVKCIFSLLSKIPNEKMHATRLWRCWRIGLSISLNFSFSQNEKAVSFDQNENTATFTENLKLFQWFKMFHSFIDFGLTIPRPKALGRGTTHHPLKSFRSWEISYRSSMLTSHLFNWASTLNLCLDWIFLHRQLQIAIARVVERTILQGITDWIVQDGLDDPGHRDTIWWCQLLHLRTGD
jgi:hypothetical protein